MKNQPDRAYKIEGSGYQVRGTAVPFVLEEFSPAVTPHLPISPSPPHSVTDLTPLEFTGREIIDRGDKMLFELVLTDPAGDLYSVRFRVRSHFVGLVNKALRRLVPEKG